ncbi:MAG TPA: hypothetical protein VNL17_14435 [Verrucomicrobiae bacterium]|nr:hypothetical protein [Verrucomicrobiae bacterium]
MRRVPAGQLSVNDNITGTRFFVTSFNQATGLESTRAFVAIASGSSVTLGPAPPGDASIVTVTQAFTTDGAGNPLLKIGVIIAPPSPLGTFFGVWVYLDAPDTSGSGVLVTDGTVALDGTTPLQSKFNPAVIKFFPYDSGNLTLSFSVPPPQQAENWRVYVVSGSAQVQNFPVQFGFTGASPSFQFVAQPYLDGSGNPNKTQAPTTFAPSIQNVALAGSLPAGWTANPNIEVKVSGDQFFEFQVTYAFPTTDPYYSQFGGFDVVMENLTTGGRRTIANVSAPADTTFASAPYPVRVGTTAYKIWFPSWDTNGNRNAIIPGVTPAVTFNITRQLGTSAQEYAANATSVVWTTGQYQDSAGGTDTRVTVSFTPPTDPAFGGARLVVKRDDGKFYEYAKGRLSPLEYYIPNPPSSVSWTAYLVSQDTNGNRNSIVDGITPSVTFTTGSATGTGDLARANPGTFSSEFQITGGVFKVKNLNADTIVTGKLQVGGSGMVSQMKVFDTLGGNIGFWGDDTAGTGYVGMWAKQCRIGGASPSSAPLQCDTSGNLSITGGTISLVSGTVTVNVDSTNFLKVTDTGGSITFSQIRGIDITTGFNSGTNKAVMTATGSIILTQAGTSSILNATSLQFNLTQVVTGRQTGPGNTTDVTDVATRFNNLLTALRTHGLIT